MAEATKEVNKNPFADAPVISSYSRAQAIEDGVLIDVSEMAREAGIRYPVAITAAVFGEVVTPPEVARANGESEEGRLWDVMQMLLWAIRGKRHQNQMDLGDGGEPDDTVWFEVLATDDHERKQHHRLWAKCGPADNLEPTITVMMVGED